MQFYFVNVLYFIDMMLYLFLISCIFQYNRVNFFICYIIFYWLIVGPRQPH